MSTLRISQKVPLDRGDNWEARRRALECGGVRPALPPAHKEDCVQGSGRDARALRERSAPGRDAPLLGACAGRASLSEPEPGPRRDTRRDRCEPRGPEQLGPASAPSYALGRRARVMKSGRHGPLKRVWPQGRVGSNPTPGTCVMSRDSAITLGRAPRHLRR